MSVILICGLNGSGKTTLGKEFADASGSKFLNDEEYWFLESEVPFSKSRTEDQAKKYVLSCIKKYKDIVIISSRGDMGERINSLYDCVVYLSAPTEIRMSRIKSRDLDRFGARVLPGGDMYEQQQAFYDFAVSRTTCKTQKWLDTLSCRVIRLDGTCTVRDNIGFLISELYPG